MKFKKILNIVLQIFFPLRCPVCDEILPFELFKMPKFPYICETCYEKLKYNLGDRCFICSKPLSSSDETYCKDCKTTKRFFDAGFGMLLHDDSARNIIYGLKFARRKDNASFIGYEMARCLGKIILFWKAEVLIPIPLHENKLRSRGFNQSELIALELSKYLSILYNVDLPVDSTFLLRSVNTRPQKKLNARQRLKNVSNAFSVFETCKYESVILLDDIMTSGATLNEASRILKDAGVKRVYFLTTSIVG